MPARAPYKGCVSDPSAGGVHRWRLCPAAALCVLALLGLLLQAGPFSAKGAGRYGSPLRFDPPPVDLEYNSEGAHRTAPVEDTPAVDSLPAPRKKAPADRSRAGAGSSDEEPRRTSRIKEAAVKERAPEEREPAARTSEAQAPEGRESGVQAPQVRPVEAPVPAPREQEPVREAETPAEEPRSEEAVAPVVTAVPVREDPAPGAEDTPAAEPQNESADVARAQAAAKPIRLFGTVEFRSLLKNVPKWERVRNAESKKPTFGSNEKERMPADVAARWSALRQKLRGASDMEKIKGVNAFFNQWPYKSDMVVWGIEDYWETPSEFIRRSGDCEDYAITKYYALRSLGMPASQLRVIAVKDSIRNIGHAVVVVYVDGDAYILDNLTNLILSHKRLTNYAPQFSVNEEYLWRHIKPLSGPKD